MESRFVLLLLFMGQILSGKQRESFYAQVSFI